MPAIFVLPILMLPLLPADVVKLSVPAVISPDVPSVPPDLESVTDRTPLPKLEVPTVVDAVSVIDVVPEVALA